MTRSSRRRALFVGINRYPHLSAQHQLFGALSDAEELADVLEQRFSFAPADLHLLLDERATRRGVLNYLDELSAESAPGDLLVWHWSGHGSQCPALPGPLRVDEPDGLAETLVPYDSRDAADGGLHVRDIADDEIRLRLVALDRRGVSVTSIFDCCHSGHVYRDSGPRIRCVPAALHGSGTTNGRLDAFAASRPELSLRLGGHRQVVLSACRDEERAAERWIGHDGLNTDLDGDGPARPAHGHFTWALLRELRAPRPGTTAGEVFWRTRARMLAESARQTPQLAGAGDRLLFGTEARSSQPWVRVGRLREDPPAAPGAESTQVELAAGSGQGIEVGSWWSLHPAGSEHADRATRLALAEVRQVGPFRSHAHIMQGEAASVRPDDRAFLHRAARGEARLTVVLEPRLSAERALLESSPYLRLEGPDCTDSDAVHVRVAAAGAHADFETLGALAVPAYMLCDVFDQPWAVQPVADGPASLRLRLERRARHRQGLRVENLDSEGWPRGLRLRLVPVGDASISEPTECDLPVYRPGDRLVFEICHQHDLPLFVYVLDFGLTDRVSQLFPLPGAEEALDPGRWLRVGVAVGDEIDLGLPADFDSPVAPCWRRDGGVEILSLFATSEATDFQMLCTGEEPALPVLRGGGSLASWIDVRSPSVTRSGREVWGVVRVPFRLLR